MIIKTYRYLILRKAPSKSTQCLLSQSEFKKVLRVTEKHPSKSLDSLLQEIQVNLGFSSNLILTHALPTSELTAMILSCLQIVTLKQAFKPMLCIEELLIWLLALARICFCLLRILTKSSRSKLTLKDRTRLIDTNTLFQASTASQSLVLTFA